MRDDELESLLNDIESDRVERKQSLSDREAVRQAICAFSNDLPHHQKPGVIFIGFRDDGSCAGLSITDELLLTLAGMRDDGNILPFPTITVQKRFLRGCEVAVVTVEPSLSPPVRLRGRTWVRVGPRRATATTEEERRLAEKRRAGDLPYDLQPLARAAIVDLDPELFSRTYLPAAVAPDLLEQNDRSLEDQLKALRFIDSAGKPSVLGILVAGKAPRDFISGAYIQHLRIEGQDLTDPICDQKEIDGPLPEMLRRLDEIIDANNSISTSITEDSLEIRRPDYPRAALQQIARNAVLHRVYEGTNAPVRMYWFSDRIEIHSPGGPFGLVNIENFGKPGITDYRNPHLAEAMRTLGYVQRFGVGIQIAHKELETNGNPPLEFDVEPTFVLATFRRRP